MIDTNICVREWLKTVSGVTTLVDDHISFPDLPTNAAPEKGEKWIQFRCNSGEAHEYAPLITADVQVTTWCNSTLTARQIYRAVFEAMHAKNNIDMGAHGYILSSVARLHGQDFRDPETMWFGCVSYFEVQFRSGVSM